jgi:hypothetical protein
MLKNFLDIADTWNGQRGRRPAPKRKAAALHAAT